MFIFVCVKPSSLRCLLHQNIQKYDRCVCDIHVAFHEIVYYMLREKEHLNTSTPYHIYSHCTRIHIHELKDLNASKYYLIHICVAKILKETTTAAFKETIVFCFNYFRCNFKSDANVKMKFKNEWSFQCWFESENKCIFECVCMEWNCIWV